MRELDRTIADSALTVRCITIGSQQKAEEFCAQHSVVGPCIGDADMHSYKAMGLEDYDLSRLQTDAALIERRAQNEAAGFRQDWGATKIEDAAQLPGAAVLDERGTIRWLYRGVHPGDLPPMADMVRVALVVDIGDDDTGIATDYAASFKKRLLSRGIPAERFHFEAVALPPPSETLTADLAKSVEFLKGKADKLAIGPLSAQPAERLTLDANGHAPRALAKAVYADAYYGGERPLDRALSAFAEHVEQATLPSLIMVCFSLAGGVGGGLAVDLARHLGNAKLGRRIPVIGVGQLPSSGDPVEMQASPRLYATLNDLDCMLDTEKNEAVVGGWGESYRNPFTGGFFAVNPEQSWQRLTATTTTGEAPIRQRFKQTVTNRFVADSLMRLVVVENGHDLVRALRPSGLEGGTNDVSGISRHWTLFNVAKLTHPGVQVLPGEPRSKWSSVIGQWVDFHAEMGWADRRVQDGLRGDLHLRVAQHGTGADDHRLQEHGHPELSDRCRFDFEGVHARILRHADRLRQHRPTRRRQNRSRGVLGKPEAL